MHDRDSFSDETPVADAVEQEQETTFEPTTSGREIPSIEADASDWQVSAPMTIATSTGISDPAGV